MVAINDIDISLTFAFKKSTLSGGHVFALDLVLYFNLVWWFGVHNGPQESDAQLESWFGVTIFIVVAWLRLSCLHKIAPVIVFEALMCKKSGKSGLISEPLLSLTDFLANFFIALLTMDILYQNL